MEKNLTLMRNSLTTVEKYTIKWFQSVINVENSSSVKKKDFIMSENHVKINKNEYLLAHLLEALVSNTIFSGCIPQNIRLHQF